MAEEQQLKEGYVFDYISGIQVKSSPEEMEATQVFSKILVEDYGYPKTNIQTRPQFHVKVRPSDNKKEYPVDIAVFSDNVKTDDSIYIIVECKKKDRKDGRSQLENYLALSKANLGVWFNSEERLFIHKENYPDGRIVIADAFETFIDGALKGGQGQFFTPRNVVKLMVDIVNPQPNEIMIDPACGSGGFLVESLRHIWSVLDNQAKDYGWTDLAV